MRRACSSSRRPRAQLDAERPASGDAETGPAAGGDPGSGPGREVGGGTGVDRPKPRPPRRFFGTVRLDPLRASRDMSVVVEEVVQHLNALPGADVDVSVEISATVRDGVGETVRRIVDENCKTLRFRSHGFEEE